METITNLGSGMDNPIGKKVIKLSGKPFKSSFKMNTIRGIIDHPVLISEQAYIFHEDDSYVSIKMCKIIEKMDSNTQK